MEVKPVRELQCRAGGLEIRFSQVTAYGLLLFLVTSRNMLVCVSSNVYYYVAFVMVR